MIMNNLELLNLINKDLGMYRPKIKTIEEHYYNLTKSSEFDENKKKFNQKELDEINQGVIERLYIKEVEKQLEKNNVPKTSLHEKNSPNNSTFWKKL